MLSIHGKESDMGRRSQYPDEFREEAVRLARPAKAESRPLAHVARELGLNAQTLTNWVHDAQVESGYRAGLTKGERAEWNALDMAIARRRPVAGLVHHTDHASQYAALTFGAELRKHKIEASMGRVRTCYDNAAAESFFATLRRT